MNKRLLFFGIAALVFLLDRATKLLVVDYIPLGSSVDAGPISISHIVNTGTAFGLFNGAGGLFSLFFIVAALTVSVYLVVKHQTFEKRLQPALGLVLGGALGNVVDRFVYGAVVDFIDVHFWPVFNIADAAITVAIVLLVILEWKKSKN